MAEASVRHGESGEADSGLRRPRLSQQTTTAVVASLTFFCLVLAVAFLPVPYVSWSPGRTVDLAARGKEGPAVRVEGLPTYPVHGQVRMTTVSVTSVDARLGLLQALVNHQRAGHDVLPRRIIYPPTKSVEQVKTEELRMMQDAKDNAVVAALRAAGQPVKQLPQIQVVVVGTPAEGQLRPGDFVLEVDGTAVTTKADIETAIRAHKVGSPVVFGISREGARRTVTVTTAPRPGNPSQPFVGIRTGVGHQYAPTVSYGINPDIVGPSAGVMFALTIYDLITPADLVAGRAIAGTGGITPEGTVEAIGGIHEKIRGAEKAGAQVFLVPAGNCADLAKVRTHMQLVKVSTLRDAITALQKLDSPDSAGVPRC